ncbi:hypothetical protein [Cerasicoccus arenae]|uniref:Uncharacterized protein n=1 Tax=Cerasicoccus arenae TaxID=424488 RepID=A0A8J3DCJ8_9BACT|nr:hypothetical protein [Cerasicoccus arenae]MBK1857585.1 hypothetical protein [Cerasicoccus arenae]GHC05753.1 hypothetical protein GCM10007047_23400 [Cerasicoccus arenae]
MMKSACIGWLRFGDFNFDVNAFLEERSQPDGFYKASERLRELHSAGFQFVGISPGPREMAKASLIAGSIEYYDAYARVSRFFAQEFGELIEWWQVANELDIWIFRDTLTMEQSVEFLKVGIRAMKDEAPHLKVGINITLYPSLPGEVDGNTEAHEGVFLAKGIYDDPTLPVDFAGFDSYPGSWRKGGPDSWSEYLDGFYELTGKPIIIMEFGYAASGGIMTEEEISQELYPCEIKKWKFSWRGEHSLQMQADYIREVMKIFSEKPFVLGAFYYNWRDAETCWQCKDADCPAETAWGLLDKNGKPKLSYQALKEYSLTLA